MSEASSASRNAALPLKSGTPLVCWSSWARVTSAHAVGCSGSTLPTVSSSASLPSATSESAAAPLNALATLAMRIASPAAKGVSVAVSATPAVSRVAGADPRCTTTEIPGGPSSRVTIASRARWRLRSAARRRATVRRRHDDGCDDEAGDDKRAESDCPGDMHGGDPSDGGSTPSTASRKVARTYRERRGESAHMVDVVVVTGIGGMGVACARRVGMGRRLVIADFNEEKLGPEADRLAADGFDVTAHRSTSRTGSRSMCSSRRRVRSGRCERSCTPLGSHPRKPAPSVCSRSTCSAPTMSLPRSSTS